MLSWESFYDLGDYRPGQAAASQARFPLVEAGFTKADVRLGVRQLAAYLGQASGLSRVAVRLYREWRSNLGTLRRVAEGSGSHGARLQGVVGAGTASSGSS